jgi:hypothetical protein
MREITGYGSSIREQKLAEPADDLASTPRG